MSAIDADLRVRLQRSIDSVQKAERIQGVSAAVMIGGEVWQGAAGLSYAGRPMTAEMVLGIGSNTKTCTAITLLRLQEQGLIDLDTQIGRWFPQQPSIDGAITVRQLLNHTSGLGDYSLQRYRDSTLADLSRIWKPRELLSFIPEKQFDAGNSWSYCNTNYLLAGIIAEEVSGQPLMQLFRRELFDPLSLDSVRLFPDEPVMGELAHRWMGGRDASSNPMNGEWSGAWAAGAVMATAAEMVQFYDALFRGAILTEASMSELLAFGGPNSYGLGISEKRVGGERIVGHSGEIRGYSSVIFWIPSLRASIAVLTNSIPSNPIAVAAGIVRELQSSLSSVFDTTSESSVLLLPCDVFRLDGSSAGRIVSSAELQTFSSGIYLLCNESWSRLVYVSPNGKVYNHIY
jgi:D-alanyl-D-alanine carboxypeptidase